MFVRWVSKDAELLNEMVDELFYVASDKNVIDYTIELDYLLSPFTGEEYYDAIVTLETTWNLFKEKYNYGQDAKN